MSSIQKILSAFTINNKGVIHKQLRIEFKHSEHLKQFLYSYYRTGAMRRENFDYHRIDKISEPFLRELRKANESSGYYVSDWLILSKLNDQYIVSRNGIKLFVNPLEHFKVSDLPAKIGDKVSIKFPKEKIFSSRGYYVAIGNKGLPYGNEQILRMYFHVKPFSAVLLLNMLTRQFSYMQPIPFIFKTLLNPEDYTRRDSAVMYFSKNNFFRIIPFIEKVRRVKPKLFARGTPLFTKRLFTGISVAEEPLKKKGIESFGEHRCRLISEGMLMAYRKNIFSESEILNLITGNFSKWKVSVKYPFLNMGSINIYNLHKGKKFLTARF